MIKTKLQLAISFVLLSFFSFSQANTLIVFAEDPNPFYVILDGIKKNEIAKTRVVIPGIEQTNSSVKIYFKDESITPVSKTIWWENANHNDEVSFRLVISSLLAHCLPSSTSFAPNNIWVEKSLVKLP